MHGLYLLWWVEHQQVSPALVAFVLAASDFFIMALELPTGRFADRFGHRISLVAGSAAQVAGMLCCWLVEGVSGVGGGCALIGIGDAFRSGADQALVYRSCVALDRERDFLQIEARTRSLESISLVVLVVLGGVIVSRWGFDAGWLAESTLSAIGLFAAWMMTEPPAAAAETDADGETPGRRTRPVSGAMFALIVPASFVAAAAGSLDFVMQTTSGADPQVLTMLVAACTLAEAGGAAIASRLSTSGGAFLQMALAMTASVVTVGALMIPVVFYPALFALGVLTGVAETLRAAAIQHAVAGDARAEAASMANLCNTAVSAICLPAAGMAVRGRRRISRRSI